MQICSQIFFGVVPYIGTWIETNGIITLQDNPEVVPYIGTWIETAFVWHQLNRLKVVPYIGTWIETPR